MNEKETASILAKFLASQQFQTNKGFCNKFKVKRNELENALSLGIALSYEIISEKNE